MAATFNRYVWQDLERASYRKEELWQALRATFIATDIQHFEKSKCKKRLSAN